MILLTGATGTLGRPLLARLLGARQSVRCLVREPRRLGPARVEVQIAIGNLADHHGMARALRGVDTVIHLATATRDQGRGSIERVNAIGTAHLIAAARGAGVTRFVYVSTLGASRHSASRILRTQAVARDAVAAAGFESLIFEASLIYGSGDHRLGVLRGLSHLPVLPVAGPDRARFQPIWSEDAADAVMAALLTERGGVGAGVGRSDVATHTHYVALAGPRTVTRDEFLRAATRSFGRARPILHVPRSLAHRSLRLQEWYLGPSAVVTWDEALLMNCSALAPGGAAEVEALGVQPLDLEDAIGG